jgi:hypothetical protein
VSYAASSNLCGHDLDGNCTLPNCQYSIEMKIQLVSIQRCSIYNGNNSKALHYVLKNDVLVLCSVVTLSVRSSVAKPQILDLTWCVYICVGAVAVLLSSCCSEFSADRVSADITRFQRIDFLGI